MMGATPAAPRSRGRTRSSTSTSTTRRHRYESIARETENGGGIQDVLMSLKRVFRLSRGFWWSADDRWFARIVLGTLCAMSVASTSLHVVMSYMNRQMMTAMSERDWDAFVQSIIGYCVVIAIAVPLFAYYNYMQAILKLRWRKWLTQALLSRYFNNRAFYRLRIDGVVDNPDQRIADDIRDFTEEAINIGVLMLNQFTQLFAFSSVLFSISPYLTLSIVLYAVGSTLIATKVFAKHMVPLNFSRLKREADFRFSLVHAYVHAESIAFYRGENAEQGVANQRFDRVFDKVMDLIGWNFRLWLFQNSFQYPAAILPAAIIAPRYFNGEVDLGAVTQAGMCFRALLRALGTIVTRFESLTGFLAGSDRLYSLASTLSKFEGDGEFELEEINSRPSTSFPTSDDSDQSSPTLLELDHVTILAPLNNYSLIDEVCFDMAKHDSLLIVGSSGCGKSSLLRTIAGLWNPSSGHVRMNHVSTTMRHSMFLPQAPYLILGSLRDQVTYPETSLIPSKCNSDGKIIEALRLAGLEDLPERVGGLDVSSDWENILSLGEQQRLAIARLMLHQPVMAFLDECTSALDVDAQDAFYSWMIEKSDCTYVSVGHRPSLIRFHRKVLVIQGNGRWQLMPAEKYRRSELANAVH